MMMFRLLSYDEFQMYARVFFDFGDSSTDSNRFD